MTTRSTDDVT